MADGGQGIAISRVRPSVCIHSIFEPTVPLDLTF